MFEVSKKLPLKDIYDKIQEELRNQYNLGIRRPTLPESDFAKSNFAQKTASWRYLRGPVLSQTLLNCSWERGRLA